MEMGEARIRDLARLNIWHRDKVRSIFLAAAPSRLDPSAFDLGYAVTFCLALSPSNA